MVSLGNLATVTAGTIINLRMERIDRRNFNVISTARPSLDAKITTITVDKPMTAVTLFMALQATAQITFKILQILPDIKVIGDRRLKSCDKHLEFTAVKLRGSGGRQLDFKWRLILSKGNLKELIQNY